MNGSTRQQHSMLYKEEHLSPFPLVVSFEHNEFNFIMASSCPGQFHVWTAAMYQGIKGYLCQCCYMFQHHISRKAQQNTNLCRGDRQDSF